MRWLLACALVIWSTVVSADERRDCFKASVRICVSKVVRRSSIATRTMLSPTTHAAPFINPKAISTAPSPTTARRSSLIPTTPQHTTIARAPVPAKATTQMPLLTRQRLQSSGRGVRLRHKKSPPPQAGDCKAPHRTRLPPPQLQPRRLPLQKLLAGGSSITIRASASVSAIQPTFSKQSAPPKPATARCSSQRMAMRGFWSARWKIRSTFSGELSGFHRSPILPRLSDQLSASRRKLVRPFRRRAGPDLL